MKLNQLIEMTMKVGSYETIGDQIQHFEQLKDTGIHCGDMEDFQVFKKSRNNFTDYAIFDQQQCIGFFVLNENVVEVGYITPTYRQQGVMSMFLFFLKRNENISQIIIGDRQSEQMITALSRIYHRFQTSWVRGSEKIPYDPQTLDQYYDTNAPTGWKLMLENNGDFSKWAKFRDESDPVNIDIIYSCFLN